ncbi:MAG: galactokinase family protein, partial [Acidobacteriota bacterium]
MIASTADRRSRRRERVVTAFRARFHRAPEIVVDAPGRIALLGAHIDDSEGFALPIAIDRGIALAAARAPGRQSTWRALDLDDEVALDPEALPAPLPERGGAARWSDLPAGVLRALRSAGGRAAQPPALEVVFGGDLPSGVGLSSSAAVSVACLLAWREAAAIDLERGDLVHLARRAERKQLGVAVGVLDP